MKKIFGSILVILCISLTSYAFLGNAFANNGDECDQGQHVGNPHCVSPTATPTPTPFHLGCNSDHVCAKISGKGESMCEENWDCHPQVTPTPTTEATPSATPTPSVTQNQGGSGTSDGGSSNPGATQPFHPSCTIPFDAPVINQVKVNVDGSITWSWLESASVDKFSIVYGKSPESLVYGQNDLHLTKNPVTQEYSYDVFGLDTSTPSWAVVYAWQGQCAELSNSFDP